MTLTQNVKPEVYNYLTNSNINEVNRYIDLPMTATQFFEEKKSPGSKEQITAELVYYWMIVLNIPFECQKWHLNKLFTLIRVCDIKSRPPKKHSRREIMKRNAALNAARKKNGTRKGEKMKKGIDISYWQGKVDFLKFPKCRIRNSQEGYRRTIDKRFEYVQGCKGNSIPIHGVYHFCYATSTVGAEEEAASCIANMRKLGWERCDRIL